MEFQAHDVEIGFHYNSAAIVPDGTPPPVKSPMGDEYVPVTRPGHRLPHAWVHQGAGKVSTLDLVGRGRFTLLTGAADTWTAAAAQATQATGTPIAVISIGPGGDYTDPSGTWAALRGTSATGAVLVRPDGHVGWRAANGEDAGGLAVALTQILPPTA